MAQGTVALLAAAAPACTVALPAEECRQLLVGRLRRWHRNSEWGFIFSELHNCDVFLDGATAQDAASLSEGDFVLFELGYDEEGQTVAQSARRAEVEEVTQQQAKLAPFYQNHMASAPEVTELPKSTTNGLGTPSSSSVAPAPAIAAPLPSAPLMVGPYEAAVAGPPGAPPLAASGRQFDGLRRAPPPPPPPLHPAPTSPGGFAPQGLGSGGMMHQQQFLAQQQHQAYAGCPGHFGGNERGYYTHQGTWPGQEPVLGIGPAGAAVAAAGPSVRLMLEPPPMLEMLDPKVLVGVLKGGPWTGLHSQTFRSSRTGTAMQLGQEWSQLLRQACNSSNVVDDVEGMHVRQHQQANAGAWVDQHQQQPAWTWGAMSVMGQMDAVHAPVGGDAYSGGTPMGCSCPAETAVRISSQMLAMHGGDAGLYASASAD